MPQIPPWPEFGLHGGVTPIGLRLASNPEAVALAMKGITIGDTGGGLVR